MKSRRTINQVREKPSKHTPEDRTIKPLPPTMRVGMLTTDNLTSQIQKRKDKKREDTDSIVNRVRVLKEYSEHVNPIPEEKWSSELSHAICPFCSSPVSVKEAQTYDRAGGLSMSWWLYKCPTCPWEYGRTFNEAKMRRICATRNDQN